ncbi:hypothetical protein KGF51_18790 [Clostridioides sp. ZZV14-6045]|uniref:hypothetical protein n=1 Tax=Clostridioides sp. ZZV14-6045 TaxID=2811489 RepID=UPI001D0F55E1|nr:hypothetical protein [Clostridioides sp. ZZV14-6045]
MKEKKLNYEEMVKELPILEKIISDGGKALIKCEAELNNLRNSYEKCKKEIESLGVNPQKIKEEIVTLKEDFSEKYKELEELLPIEIINEINNANDNNKSNKDLIF